MNDFKQFSLYDYSKYKTWASAEIKEDSLCKNDKIDKSDNKRYNIEYNRGINGKNDSRND